MARNKPVVRDDGRGYPSARAAATESGAHHSAVLDAIRTGHRCYGHTYRYMTEEESDAYVVEHGPWPKPELHYRDDAPRLKLPGTGPCRSCAKWTPLPGIRGMGDCADGYRSAPTDTCDRYEGRRSR